MLPWGAGYKLSKHSPIVIPLLLSAIPCSFQQSSLYTWQPFYRAASATATLQTYTGYTDHPPGQGPECWAQFRSSSPSPGYSVKSTNHLSHQTANQAAGCPTWVCPFCLFKTWPKPIPNQMLPFIFHLCFFLSPKLKRCQEAPLLQLPPHVTFQHSSVTPWLHAQLKKFLHDLKQADQCLLENITEHHTTQTALSCSEYKLAKNTQVSGPCSLLPPLPRTPPAPGPALSYNTRKVLTENKAKSQVYASQTEYRISKVETTQTLTTDSPAQSCFALALLIPPSDQSPNKQAAYTITYKHSP